MQTSNTAVSLIEHWLDSMVVGLNLCPFANAVRRQGLVNIVIAPTGLPQECLQALADEARRLLAGDDQATTLLVLPEGFDDFDDYLDLLAIAEDLLVDLDYEGQLQLASFHPHYQFEGTAIDDVSNWTNRAPLPILHLLQEASLSRAVAAHPDPEAIPQRNIEVLESLGMNGIRDILGD